MNSDHHGSRPWWLLPLVCMEPNLILFWWKSRIYLNSLFSHESAVSAVIFWQVCYICCGIVLPSCALKSLCRGGLCRFFGEDNEQCTLLIVAPNWYVFLLWQASSGGSQGEADVFVVSVMNWHSWQVCAACWVMILAGHWGDLAMEDREGIVGEDNK